MRPFSWCAKVVLALVVAIAAARSPAADEPVRVMTFNVRYGTANDGEDSWPKRKELLLATIRKFDPDLLGAAGRLPGLKPDGLCPGGGRPRRRPPARRVFTRHVPQ